MHILCLTYVVHGPYKGGNMNYSVTFLVLIGVYMLPGLIAALRRHRNQNAIFILNLLLGWTLLGWIAALVWAATNDARQNAS